MENNFYINENNIKAENPQISQYVSCKSDRFVLNVKDSAFKIIICVSAVILTFFGIWGEFRAGFTASALILFTVMTCYFADRGTRLRFYPLLCGVLNCALAACFTVTSNSGVRFLSVICMSVLSAVWFVALTEKPSCDGDLALISNIAVPFVKAVTVSLPNTFAAVFSSKPKNSEKLGKIIAGICLAVPVLIIVVPLLMMSDAAFTGLVSRIAANSLLMAIKIIVGLILSLFIISYCFTVKKCELPKSGSLGAGFIDSTIVISFLSALSICYLSYLFSQLAYFFSAFKGILPQNYEFTMANYARRGFFEMTVIASINFVIIFLSFILSKKVNGKICIPLKILCTFVGSFTLIIIATALSKMFLYIKSYGMTELRITTSAFMVFLSAVTVSIMLRVFIRKIRVLKVSFVAAACVLIVLGTVNVNRVIADYNYNAYITGALKEIDVQTIYNTGEEGIPYLVQLTNNGDEQAAAKAEDYLKNIIIEKNYYEYETEISYEGVYSKHYKITGRRYDGIGEYSIPRSQAYESLDKYLKDNPDILE